MPGLKALLEEAFLLPGFLISLGLRHQSRLLPLLRATAKTTSQLLSPKLAEFHVKMGLCTFMICMGFYHSMQVLIFCLSAENSNPNTQLFLSTSSFWSQHCHKQLSSSTLLTRAATYTLFCETSWLWFSLQ